MSMMLVLTPLFSSSLSVIAEEGTSATEMTSESETTASTAEATTENKTESSTTTEKTPAQVEAPTEKIAEADSTTESTESKTATENSKTILQSPPTKALKAAALAQVNTAILQGTERFIAADLFIPGLENSDSYQVLFNGEVAADGYSVSATADLVLDANSILFLTGNIGVYTFKLSTTGIENIRKTLATIYPEITESTLPSSSIISNAKVIVEPGKVVLENTGTSAKQYDGLPITIPITASFGGTYSEPTKQYSFVLQEGEYEATPEVGGSSDGRDAGTYKISITKTGIERIKADLISQNLDFKFFGKYPVQSSFATKETEWGTFDYTINPVQVTGGQITFADRGTKEYDGTPLNANGNIQLKLNDFDPIPLESGDYTITPKENGDASGTAAGKYAIALTTAGYNRIKASNAFKNYKFGSLDLAGISADYEITAPAYVKIKNPEDPSQPAEDNKVLNNNSETQDTKPLSLDALPKAFNFETSEVSAKGRQIPSTITGTQQIQVSDRRTDNTGWTVRVKQSSFTNTDGSGATLTGANILLNGVTVRNSLQNPPTTTLPFSKENPFVISTEENVFYSSSNLGTTVISWNAADVRLQTQDNTEKTGSYQSTVDWTLTAGAEY